jgi:hypothetical protein
MKKVIYALSILALSGIEFSSCQKVEELKDNGNSLNNSKTNLQNKSSYEPVFECYLDKKLISKSKINFNDENIYISITKKDNEVIIIDAFTRREDYILYGEKHNLKLKELLLFEDEMKDFVKKNDIISLYNESEKLPKWYVDFEAKTYQKHFGGSSQQKSALTMLHKNLVGGPDRLVGVTTPQLWGGFNNAVSAFTPIGIWGFTSLYDKSFYRARLATIWGFGMTRVFLNTSIDNKTTSVITG